MVASSILKFAGAALPTSSAIQTPRTAAPTPRPSAFHTQKIFGVSGANSVVGSTTSYLSVTPVPISAFVMRGAAVEACTVPEDVDELHPDKARIRPQTSATGVVRADNHCLFPSAGG